MTGMLRTIPPGDNSAFRHALYRGSIFHFSATATTTRLVSDVLSLVRAELGEAFREAQFRLDDATFFNAVGRLRKTIYTSEEFQTRVRDIMRETTFEPNENAFDPIRIRVISHGGHTNPKAAPIYFAHRDTWYANPQAQLTWWIPLHDVSADETFEFWPDCFDSPIANDSAAFDFDAWTKHGQSLRIGWQNAEAGRTETYPKQGNARAHGERIGFSARAGEIILFAGAHLHQTRNNESGRTRFSVDFRTVHLGDHERGIGSPNADNRSAGSAMRDWVQPAMVSRG